MPLAFSQYAFATCNACDIQDEVEKSSYFFEAAAVTTYGEVELVVERLLDGYDDDHAK